MSQGAVQIIIQTQKSIVSERLTILSSLSLSLEDIVRKELLLLSADVITCGLLRWCSCHGYIIHCSSRQPK